MQTAGTNAKVARQPGEPTAAPRQSWWFLVGLLVGVGLVAFLGALIWFIYAFSAGVLTIFGNCGPNDFIGRGGELHGGATSSGFVAALIGGVLFVWAGAALWRFPDRWRGVVLAYGVSYGAALVVLAYLVSPLVWGHEHCVMY
jgi:hypothetical protein